MYKLQIFIAGNYMKNVLVFYRNIFLLNRRDTLIDRDRISRSLKSDIFTDSRIEIYEFIRSYREFTDCLRNKRIFNSHFSCNIRAYNLCVVVGLRRIQLELRGEIYLRFFDIFYVSGAGDGVNESRGIICPEIVAYKTT